MRDILKLINTARSAFRMAPLKGLPRGIPEKSRLCVLARALRFEVLLDEEDRPFALVRQYRQAKMLASAWCVNRPEEAWSGWSVPLPRELSEFVHQFDARRHPELILVGRLAELHAARTELQSLRLRLMRMQVRASVLAAEGREIYGRSREVLAQSRQLYRRTRLERWMWRTDTALQSPVIVRPSARPLRRTVVQCQSSTIRDFDPAIGVGG
jgi:hypothetical protein